MFNLSIKFPSDVNFVNAPFSHTKIWLHYVMFSSDLLYSAWHFPPRFLFFPSLCWKVKLFLTVPEALSFVLHSCLYLCRASIPPEPLCSPGRPLGSLLQAGTARSRGSTARDRHPWMPRSRVPVRYNLENGEGKKK